MCLQMNHTKFHCPRPNSCFGSIFKQSHQIGKNQFSFTMQAVKIPTGKTFFREQKRASFELWKAKVPLKEIGSHIRMAEVTLRRILTIASNYPDDPCPDQKAGSGKRSRSLKSLMEFMPRRLQEVIDREG
jgi:hypothetical protein